MTSFLKAYSDNAVFMNDNLIVNHELLVFFEKDDILTAGMIEDIEVMGFIFSICWCGIRIYNSYQYGYARIYSNIVLYINTWSTSKFPEITFAMFSDVMRFTKVCVILTQG